jgi:beta-glucosidase
MLKAAAGGALGAMVLPESTQAAAPSGSATQSSAARRFPSGFRWGTATSSYQIEGAAKVDGRGPTIWDTFCRVPGKVKGGATGDIANDHYHRYKEDVRLMKSLGVDCYRFSIAWSRVFPQGRGAVNQKGLDFYSRLVDELLANGIAPFATLYHWDLPQALQDRHGGWESRDVAQAFGDYAAVVAQRLSDRVKHFFTTNELLAFIELGYGNGVHAPGLSLPRGRLNQTRHHAVLGHGLAAQAIRAHGRSGTQIGLAENINVVVPLSETPENIRAAEIATREVNAGYLTVILEGRYTDAFLAAAGAEAPKFTADDLKIISTPLDFVGVNIYRPAHYVRASAKPPGYQDLPMNASHPRMASSWHQFDPVSIYWGVRHVANVWRAKEIYVTENGCAASDGIAADGNVYDMDRVMFLRSHLAELQRASAEGAPVRGYFLWSLMDNFEWADGYDMRFGVVYVDFATQRRTPKASAGYYREVVAQNRVL